MAMTTVSAVAAKSTIVPRAIANALLWINVKERALFSCATFAVLGKKVTDGHLGDVVFMQVVTKLILLAETANPVLAYFIFRPYVSKLQENRKRINKASCRKIRMRT